MSWIKLLVGSGIAFALFNKGKEVFDQITWQLRPLKLSDVRAFKGEFDLTLEIRNNSAINISLKGWKGHILRGGTIIGDFNSSGNIELPAGEGTGIKSVVKLREGTLDEILEILEIGGLLNEPLVVSGYLVTSVVDVPVKRTIELKKVS